MPVIAIGEEGALSKDERDVRWSRDAEERRATDREPTPEPLHERIVHTRVAFGADGEVAHDETVFCNLGERSVSVDGCKGCSRFSAVVGTAGVDRKVMCRSIGTAGLRLEEHGTRSTQTVLSNLGRRKFACVRADASLDTVERLLLDEGADALPVIDDVGRPIGLVSKTDVLRRYRDGVEEVVASELPHAMHADLRAEGTAADVMSPLVRALPEDAPLSFAIALLAIEGISQVPIVDEIGSVVGLFTATDAIRWLAIEMGYVVAPPGT